MSNEESNSPEPPSPAPPSTSLSSSTDLIKAVIPALRTLTYVVAIFLVLMLIGEIVSIALTLQTVAKISAVQMQIDAMDRNVTLDRDERLTAAGSPLGPGTPSDPDYRPDVAAVATRFQERLTQRPPGAPLPLGAALKIVDDLIDEGSVTRAAGDTFKHTLADMAKDASGGLKEVTVYAAKAAIDRWLKPHEPEKPTQPALAQPVAIALCNSSLPNPIAPPPIVPRHRPRVEKQCQAAKGS